MLSRRRFLHTIGIGAAAAVSSQLPLRAFEPARHSQAVDEKTALGARRASQVLLNSNENPYGPLASVRGVMQQALSWANRYPDFDYDALVVAIADLHKVKHAQVLTGCGSTEILRTCATAFLGPGKKLIVADPTFEAVAAYAGPTGAQVVSIPLTSNYAHDLDAMLAAAKSAPSLVYICNPNNPTASLTPRKDLDSFCAALPGNSYVLMDEAYHHFAVGAPEYESFLDRSSPNRNVIVARTFSKIFGMAGMRLGYSVASPEVSELLRRQILQDNVNMVAAQAGLASIQDVEGMQAAAKRIAADREQFFHEAQRRNLKVIPSYANFAMLNAGMPAMDAIEHFRKNGILIGRHFHRMDNFVRISFGKPEEMQQFWKVWDAKA
jgi:histidinol-phosphate aminotransferase